MKKTVLTLLISCCMGMVMAQPKTEKIEKLYYSNTNVIQYSYSSFPEKLTLDLNESDTVSPGTDTGPEIVMTALIGKDTLRIYGDNYPYQKHSYVTVQTPAGRKTILFRFNSAPSHFPASYIKAHQNKTLFETPEVYELANIIWTLSPSGEKAKDLQKNTTYYQQVKAHFAAFLQHPVFEHLITNDSSYFQQYYEFRENSYMYKFDGPAIVKGENYNYVFGNDWEGYQNKFTELLPLIQDFADKSNFRKFYQEHIAFYESNKREVRSLMPVQEMWGWLEREFPIKVDAYKIIFSPLILGSHSTQKYLGLRVTSDSTYSFYTETLMFICDAEHLQHFKNTSGEEKKGLMSGIVFTEIDHNYVNPVSSNYWNEIDSIFSKPIWTDANKNVLYDNPFSVFNEYMTHALFCLWVNEYFDATTAASVIEKRVQLNVKQRGFIKFADFNTALLQLRKEYPLKKVAELYPQILAWSKKQLQP